MNLPGALIFRGCDRVALRVMAAPAGRVRTNGREAFSIIEMLVATTVLALLTVLLATAFSNFAQMASTSSSRMETSKQARTLFDRMAFDLGAAVRSGTAKIVFIEDGALAGATASNNDALLVLTDAKTSDRFGRLAVVGYEVGTYPDQTLGQDVETVLRHVEPFDWWDDTTTISIAGGDDAFSQPIAPGILRLELAYLMADGEILGEPPGTLAGLDAIICAIAILDEDTTRRITPGQRAQIAGMLGNAETNQTPMAVWQNTDLSALPTPVIQGLRFHERIFRLR